MNSIKVYQVRVSFKSTKPFVKIKPSSHTGIVLARNKKEAEAKAIEVSKRGADHTILISATSKSLPSTFILSTFKGNG